MGSLGILGSLISLHGFTTMIRSRTAMLRAFLRTE